MQGTSREEGKKKDLRDLKQICSAGEVHGGFESCSEHPQQQLEGNKAGLTCGGGCTSHSGGPPSSGTPHRSCTAHRTPQAPEKPVKEANRGLSAQQNQREQFQVLLQHFESGNAAALHKLPWICSSLCAEVRQEQRSDKSRTCWGPSHEVIPSPWHSHAMKHGHSRATG